jgi:hypothetical protein
VRHRGRTTVGSGCQDLGTTAVPAKTALGGYLMALLVKQHGFQCFRRDESTGLWIHKNGAIEVESLYDWAAEKSTAITDATMGQIAMDPRIIGCSMQLPRICPFQMQGCRCSVDVTRVKPDPARSACEPS